MDFFKYIQKLFAKTVRCILAPLYVRQILTREAACTTQSRKFFRQTQRRAHRMSRRVDAAMLAPTRSAGRECRPVAASATISTCCIATRLQRDRGHPDAPPSLSLFPVWLFRITVPAFSLSFTLLVVASPSSASRQLPRA